MSEEELIKLREEVWEEFNEPGYVLHNDSFDMAIDAFLLRAGFIEKSML